ncbi:hypothetical protein [Natronorubrum bangense]|uniref:Uncharacterized protein n=2 Tax=Natronorubrum bangense TaxID=61858 RepID=L9WKB0_9EURY|nr:hypothetical protein [Natronorubrum bangense]ELY49889.1 hypothetical protein C494_07760 [Natronorubrum bangense JCM 10635]QCC55508.1 hypothetical protein DV706_14135 [Natronorubrum bangense]
MVDIGIATAGAEQPINRHGAVAGETMHEGDLVGIDADGHMVKADAGAGSDQLMAIGALLTPADDLSNYDQEEVKLVIEANRALVGRDRVSTIAYGVEVENGDGDWAFTPGLPVYLDVGGGYTQTAPSSAGDLVQVVGTALTEDRIMLAVQPHTHTA